ncbi:armadillo repeat protein, putative [Medicago truncatula]|uniref:Armadillo repeat protein, putative n=1 Tax=Medicago truncatula TaxID=3880 RepID=G7K3I2_MEDTR|nr:armadillo repeat protein, putative [Medicago truncatula]
MGTKDVFNTKELFALLHIVHLKAKHIALDKPLDGPLLQESAVGALGNLVGSISAETLIIRCSTSRRVFCCIPLLINMLESKANGERKLAAQAIASLMILSQNRREIKKDSVPNSVE